MAARSKALGIGRVRLFRIEVPAPEGVLHLGLVDLAPLSEPVERGDGDALGIYLKVTAQRTTRVATAEAVGAERGETAGNPAANLIGNHLHVVGDGDDRPGLIVEDGCDIRLARLFRG